MVDAEESQPFGAEDDFALQHRSPYDVGVWLEGFED